MSSSTPAMPMRVIVTQSRSLGIALLLTFFLGPLGLLYASVSGALLLIVGGVVAGGGIAVAAAAKGNLAMIALVPPLLGLLWLTSMVWAAIATNRYNRKLASEASPS
jgi:hypothetical protein